MGQKTNSGYGGFCGSCGEPLKPLWTSWFCDCAAVEAKLAYCLSDLRTLDSFQKSGFIPKGSILYLFKDMDIAQDYAESYLTLVVLEADISLEGDVVWSEADAFTAHTVRGNLPFKVVQ